MVARAETASMSDIFDVVVIGLGAMGAASAYSLAKRGARVLGLEQFAPGHDLGSSHGESRVIRQAYFESPAYVPLALSAYDLWRQVEAESGQSLMRITGGMMIGPRDSQVVQGSLRSATEYSLPHEILDAQEIRKRFPLLRPPPEFVGLFEHRLGVLSVEACVRALLELAKNRGAELRFGQRVEAWHADSGTFRVRTGEGTIRAGKLVLTPGPWAGGLLQSSLPLQVQRLTMHWFQPNISIQEFLPERFPVHLWELQDETCFYGFPAMGDGKRGVKMAFHSVRTACSPDEVARTVSSAETAHLRQTFREFIPALDGPELSAKTCMYTTTPDAHFVLGRHPRFDGAFVACGFSGHGFKFSPVVGEVMAGLAIEGRTRAPIEPFDPMRFEAGGSGG